VKQKGLCVVAKHSRGCAEILLLVEPYTALPVHCMACEKVFGGILIQPYSYLIISSLSFSVLKEISFLFWKKYLSSFLLKALKSKAGGIGFTEPLTEIDLQNIESIDNGHQSAITPNDILDRRISESIASIQRMNEFEEKFNQLQNLFGLIFFIFICIITPEKEYSVWENYSHICAALMYSPTLTSLVSMIQKQVPFFNHFPSKVKSEINIIRVNHFTVGCEVGYFPHDIEIGFAHESPLHTGHITEIMKSKTAVNLTLENGHQVFCAPLEFVELSPRHQSLFDNLLKENEEISSKSPSTLLFVLIPVYLTHFLPGLVLYIWVVVLALFVSSPVGIFFEVELSKPLHTRGHLASFLLAWWIRLSLLIAIQVLVNYSLLFYQSSGSPSSYINVISYEFHLRLQNQCYLEERFEDMQSIISWLSWL
jgi:hypothetical protein